MTKIDIFSGFLGAGKTTLIKKLIAEAYKGERLVLIENEFGEIGIDGGFMQEAGIEVTEMNSGCICCSLVGDFTTALGQVLEQYAPDRILIEPSGVGKLSDVVRAVKQVESDTVVLNSYTAVADAAKCRVYMKNFGEFYNDQIAHAGCIILSRTEGMSEEKLAACVALLREKNPEAPIVTTPWTQLTGEQILEAMERRDALHGLREELEAEGCPVCGHHHHHEDGEECHCHDHHHHGHHHHADEVFDSWGLETARAFTAEEIAAALDKLQDEAAYGIILRAKGIVAGQDGNWIHFDYVPGCPDVRTGPAAVSGRLCVIGSNMNKKAVAALFQTSGEG